MKLTLALGSLLLTCTSLAGVATAACYHICDSILGNDDFLQILEVNGPNDLILCEGSGHGYTYTFRIRPSCEAGGQETDGTFTSSDVFSVGQVLEVDVRGSGCCVRICDCQ